MGIYPHNSVMSRGHCYCTVCNSNKMTVTIRGDASMHGGGERSHIDWEPAMWVMGSGKEGSENQKQKGLVEGTSMW